MKSNTPIYDSIVISMQCTEEDDNETANLTVGQLNRMIEEIEKEFARLRNIAKALVHGY